MELGLERDEVKIIPYDKLWEKEFYYQKSLIINSLNIEDFRIEHIGSTAIKTMSAKPIIDILLGVSNFDEIDKIFQDKLKSLGYLRLKVEKDNEIVFAKFKDHEYNIKTHFLHITIYENKLWKDLIKFRDILNNSEELRKEYLNIKLDYLKENNTGIINYTNHKKEFVNKIINL